jgi:hypothetical protein
MSTGRIPKNPILLVDDEQPVIDSREVMTILRSGEFELILLDLTTPHLPGEKLLAAIHEEMPCDAVSRQSSPTLALADSRRTSAARLPREPGEAAPSLLAFSERLPTLDQGSDLLVDEAMRRAHGNQSIAAGIQGVSHQALSKRLHQRKPQE